MVIRSRRELRKRLKRKTLIGPKQSKIAAGILFVFGLAMFGFVGSADTTYAETLDYNVNVEPALNVTIPTDTISLLLDPTNKTFSSQELNISVGTNNPYGYRLTMSSTGTSLIHTEDSSLTIPTLPTLTGGYTDETFVVDKWGYKKDSSAWNSYTSGITLLESNAPVNNDNTNLTFGAKIDYDQAPGNYTLVLNFNAVAKVATNDLVITFAGSGVDSVKVCTVAGDCTGDNLIGTVSISGGSVPGLEDGSTYYLYPTFQTNYEFLSWEKTSTAGTISDTTALNPTFTMNDEPASVTITGKVSLPDLAIQDVTASTCNTTARDVYDKRDNEIYKIQKLADGNCWLLDNLRLGSDTTMTLTPNDTNIDSNYTLPASGTTCFETTANCDSSGDDTHTGYTVPAINTDSKNTINSDSSENWGNGSHKYGVYYNYCAASAGTICTASNSSNATYDVCPKGWRMPTGGAGGEYQALCTAVKGSACDSPDSSTEGLLLRDKLSLPLSGRSYDGSASYQGVYGYFWSSTRYNNTYMYYLFVGSSNVGPQNNATRYVGRSVRCVLDERTISDVAYMQDVNSAVVANTAEGATATLRDRRDNQDYTIAKINGDLWMTRNLAIGCDGSGSTYGSSMSSKTLTSADSNVASSWSTPTASLAKADGTSGCTTSDTSDCNSYTTPRMKCSSDYGAWYNYAATSVGTITDNPNTVVDTYNICPKGWTLPASPKQSGITSQPTAFSPVTGGYYVRGGILSSASGYWWFATVANANNRHDLIWSDSSLSTYGASRSNGLYVRCVRNS